MNKKGFTLIELLAVIVVLAIIALIATPIVMNVIKDAQRSALVRSAENYISAVDISIANENMKENIVFNPTKCTINTDGNLNCDGYNNIIIVDMNNKKPKSGTIKFDNYKVENVVLNYGDNKVVLTAETDSLEYMEVPTSVSFGEDSWEAIALNVKIGNISKYNVGDVKNIELDIDGDGKKTAYAVRIANTSTPEECNSEGFSQTACGFVVEFVSIIADHYMNSTNINAGGWPASELREYIGGYVDEEDNFVEGTIYKTLPPEIKNIIKDTYVVSGHGSKDVGTNINGNFESIDKLYLLSTKEISGGISEWEASYDETRQLDYYFGGGTPKKSNKYWWLRSASRGNNSQLYAIGVTGGLYIQYATNVLGVAPAFRIG